MVVRILCLAPLFHVSGTGGISQSQLYFKLSAAEVQLAISSPTRFSKTGLPEVSLIVPDFTISAVHVILSFLLSFSLLFFLYLFLVIPSCLGDDSKYKEKANEAEKEIIT